jgi:transcriptional regulator with XRE-family HTH domain
MPKNKKTNIEQYVINRIKEIRIEKGFSQEDIASALDFTRGFIGQIESPNNPAKYNLNHLNILARELKCSPKDFLPDIPIVETRKKKSK